MKRMIMAAFVIWWAVFSLWASALAQPAEISLRIIGINDFHGALIETSSYAGAAKMASAVKTLSEEKDGNVLILAAGDMMQGSMESNLERGQTVIEMMNLIGVDAMVLGNHEFDWGLDILQTRIEEMRFPCLAANVREKDAREVPHYLHPYTIIEQAGLRVGIVGLVTEDTATSVNPKYIRTLTIDDPILAARDAVRAVKTEGADIVILLAHMGCYQDEITGELSGEAAELAAIDGVDLIVSGHSHTIVNGNAEKVPIVQAGSKGKYLDVVDIVYSREENEIVSYQTKLYEVDGRALSPHRKMKTLVEKAVKKVDKIRRNEVGQLTYSLPHDRRAVSPLGSWVSDGIREAVGADIALQNGGGIRVDVLEAGSVTEGELYEMLPFDNTICTAYLTGAQIRDVLEQGLFDDNHSILQYAGMTVICDMTKPQGSRIISVHLSDGRPLLMGEKYLVAYNDFMAARGDGYPHLTAAEELRNTGINLREAVGEYLRGQGGKALFETRFYQFSSGSMNHAA